ncbi:MAG: superoxide dismutase [Candidatus Vogelbacteria bacterium]|nr:superoxide dismutase [Candidatus Vogelbacteria bacterium]
MKKVTFEEKKFQVGPLEGLSSRQIEEHLKLYGGYVRNCNLLIEKITLESSKESSDALMLSELRRRLGFEFNGMRLHEIYFDSLQGTPSSALPADLILIINEQFRTIDNLISEIKKMALMRGIGWVLLLKDKVSGSLLLNWVSDHEIGHLAGARVVLALDVWEHAYLLDYLPGERTKYVDAFFKNLDWEKVSNNYNNK